MSRTFTLALIALKIQLNEVTKIMNQRIAVQLKAWAARLYCKSEIE
jgi:hypothetical protein